MNIKTRNALLIAGLVLALTLISCQLASSFLGGEQSPPAAVAPSEEAVQAAPPETAVQPPASQAEPSDVPPTEAPPEPPEQPETAPVGPAPCAEEVCIEKGTFLLQRPLAGVLPQASGDG